MSKERSLKEEIAEMKRALIIVRFHTNDESFPYYDCPVVVFGRQEEIDSLPWEFDRFTRNHEDEELDYDVILESVLNYTNLHCENACGSIMPCEFVRIIDV